MDEELKSCPYCGGSAAYVDDTSFYGHVKCMNCGIRTVTANKDYVTGLWNQRVQG